MISEERLLGEIILPISLYLSFSRAIYLPPTLLYSNLNSNIIVYIIYLIFKAGPVNK